MANVEELRERARELDIEGRSKMDKEELEKAIAEAEGGSSEGHESEASDPEVVGDDLSPEGQEALAEMGEDSEAAAEADLALDASGPLHLEKPSERVMTGAVSEEHAKEQEERVGELPEDHVGDLTEAGEPLNTKEAEEKQQEDVIDYPPPLAEREEAKGVEVDDKPAEAPPRGVFSSSAVAGSPRRTFDQKSQMYTDGLSGGAESNLERAYELPEILQSSDPVQRAAGDESLSPAARAQKSDEEESRAEFVKSRDE